MKRALIVCAGLGACMLTLPVHAATLKTEVDVNISSGGLVLHQPVNMNFDVGLPGHDRKVSDKNDSKITVSDFRGTAKDGWRVTARLMDEKFGGLGLTFGLASQENYVRVPNERLNLNGQESEVALVTGDSVKNERVETSIDLNAELKLPDKVLVGERKNAIIWNIQDVPVS